MAVLIYAFGSGWGHLQRAVALAQAYPSKVHIFCNSIYTPLLQSKISAHWHHFPPDVTPATVQQALRKFQQSIESFWVDAFPRGLGGELAEYLAELPAQRRILIQRTLHPDYVTEDLKQFVAQHYTHVIVAGETALFVVPKPIQTAAWLACRAEDCLSRQHSRQALGIEQSKPCVAVLVTGTLSEQGLFRQLISQLVQVLPSAEIIYFSAQNFRITGARYYQVSDWYPALRYLRAANVLVGSGGYHTVHEAQALRLPLVSLPLPRRYDRQQQRLQNWQQREGAAPVKIATDLQAAVSSVKDFLQYETILSPIHFQNGVEQALEELASAQK